MVVIGTDNKIGTAIELSDESRLMGLYVIGKPGMGKSTLFLNLIAQDIENGAGVALLDPHGDLTEDILHHIPEHRRVDVVYLDAGETGSSFGLNLFEPMTADRQTMDRTADNVVQIFKKLWGTGESASWGPRMENLLRQSAYVFVENEGLTLADLPSFLTDKAFREKALEKITQPVVSSYFQNTYPKNARVQDEWASPILNKVYEFLLSSALYNIVSQKKTTINFRSIMDEGKILLVKLALGQVGDDVVSLLGSVLVGQILEAAKSRVDVPRGTRRPFFLYADEYQRFDTPSFATLIEEARKYAVGTAIAHQQRAQLTPFLRSRPLASLNVVVFQVTPQDSEELAGLFDATPPLPEVTGTRSKMIPTRKAVEYLIEHGHRDKNVLHFINEVLKPIVDRDPAFFVLKPVSTSDQRYGINPWDLENYQKQEQDAVDIIDSFNLYFLKIMRGDGLDRNLLAHIFKLLVDLSNLPHYSIAGRKAGILDVETEHWSQYRSHQIPDFPPYYLKTESERIRSSLVFPTQEEQQMMMWAHEDNGRDYPMGFPGYVTRVLPVFLAERRAGAYEIFAWLFENKFGRDPDTVWSPELELERVKEIQDDFRQIVAYKNLILKVTIALSESPLMVNSGEQEPIYGPQRTYADMLGEIANDLSQLPQLTARYRILTPAGHCEGRMRVAIPDAGERFTPDGTPYLSPWEAPQAPEPEVIADEPRISRRRKI